MALTIEAAEAKIRFYEEQKKLLAKRDTEVPALTEKLESYAGVLTVPQRRKIAKLVGGTIQEDLDAAAKAAASKATTKKPGKKSVAKKGIVPKRYQVGDIKWSGRGRPPKAFVEWADSDEGKAWREANPDQKWPPIEAQKKKDS